MAEVDQKSKTSVYTIEPFQAAYDLPLTAAVELFERSGPSKHDLDPLMKARGNQGNSDYWLRPNK